MNSNILEEYIFEYEVFLANQEVNEQLFQLECGYINESMGLMSINEALIDTLKTWFDKIYTAIEGIINKLQTKLAGIYSKQLEKLGNIINDPGRLDPVKLNVPITNYHGYDFTKFNDGTFDAKKSFENPDFMNTVAGLVGGGNGQPQEKLSKQDILKAVYPQLYDENLSVFDKMRELILTTGKDTNQETILNGDILDAAWKFVSEDYKNLIEKIKADRDAVKNQKKNVDAAAQQLLNNVQNTAQNAPTPDNQVVGGESYVFCEGYLLLEKDEDVKDQKIGGADGEQPIKKENYVRALMTYIQVATDIISAKTKIVNSTFMDKMRIVLYYSRRAK